MEKTFIYALRNPITEEIFYIGKSDQPKKRLFNHLQTAKSYYDVPPLYELLKLLMDQNKNPDLLILDEVDVNMWEDKEKEYIEFYKGRGNNLLNKTSGGKVFSDRMRRRSIEANRKPILQYDLSGNFIREWQSIRFAARELKHAKSSIYCSLNTKQKTSIDSYWRYKTSDNIPLTIKIHPKKSTNKPVFQIKEDGSKIKWDSIRLAAKGLGLNESHLSSAIRKGQKIHGIKFEKDLSNKRWQKPFGKLNQALINYNYIDLE